ncbi:MAG TPA: hypothetical protein VGH28_00285 [Polyangiaceae bacterium]|jgi:hypothetical protein
MDVPFASQLADVFRPMFGDGPAPPPRVVVPVVLPETYRGVGPSSRSVDVAIAVPCRPCRSAGCRVCERVGWTVRDISVSVSLPAGASDGTEIPPPASLASAMPAFLFRIVRAGPEAERLTRRQREHDSALRAAWTHERDRHRRERSRAKRILIVVVGMPLACVFLLWTREYLAKGRLGERCALATTAAATSV